MITQIPPITITNNYGVKGLNYKFPRHIVTKACALINHKHYRAKITDSKHNSSCCFGTYKIHASMNNEQVSHCNSGTMDGNEPIWQLLDKV